MHSITSESAICTARNLISSLLPKTAPPIDSRLALARDLLDMAISWEHESEQYEDSRQVLEERLDELAIAVAELHDALTAGAPDAATAGAPDGIELCDACSAKAEANAGQDGEIIELCDDCGSRLKAAADPIHVDQSPEYVDEPHEH